MCTHCCKIRRPRTRQRCHSVCWFWTNLTHISGFLCLILNTYFSSSSHFPMRETAMQGCQELFPKLSKNVGNFHGEVTMTLFILGRLACIQSWNLLKTLLSYWYFPLISFQILSGASVQKSCSCSHKNSRQIHEERLTIMAEPSMGIFGQFGFVLSVRLRTKGLWVHIPLLSFRLQIWRLFQARRSLTFRQLLSVDSLWNV